jgi:hypothetical protein
MQCSLCGFNIPSNADFCVHCGKYQSQRSNLGFRPWYRREDDTNLQSGSGHHAGQHQCPNCQYWNSGGTGICLNCRTTLSPSYSYAFGRHGSSGYASGAGTYSNNSYFDESNDFQSEENQTEYVTPKEQLSPVCPNCKALIAEYPRKERDCHTTKCQICKYAIDQELVNGVLHQRIAALELSNDTVPTTEPSVQSSKWSHTLGGYGPCPRCSSPLPAGDFVRCKNCNALVFGARPQ